MVPSLGTYEKPFNKKRIILKINNFLKAQVACKVSIHLKLQAGS